ncbi:MAG: PQQ-dependent sugar dehydrogenase, partial [Planctomycetaceae bacterium]
WMCRNDLLNRNSLAGDVLVMLRSIILTGVAVVWGSQCVSPLLAAELNTLTESEKRSGWKLLFDGRSTSGWRNYQKKTVGQGWKVVGGELRRVGSGAGDIVTVDQYASFELSLEYKISKGGNSGIMFHVTEAEKRPWQTGPEIQIQDASGHDPQKAGWLYQLYPAKDDACKPTDAWNQVRVRISPDLCAIYMNGVRYARFKKGSADWDRRVAASKFSKFANFGKATRGHICLQDHGNLVSFRNVKIRSLDSKQATADPIDGTLPLQAQVAFPNLKWSGWSPVTEQGRTQALRPIVLTHAGDDSNRMFVATQHGVLHVFKNDQAVKSTKVFLDMRSKVSYNDKQNEEGLLGLAFHPNYKKTGEFFVYYSTTKTPQTSIVSRFRVSPDDPDRADPVYEEVLLRVEQPYWNHNGGTLAFGPDGYLYVALGDGGAGNDPHNNAQDLKTLLGSILRIDIDQKSSGKNYAIPANNPFVGTPDKARGEIWAYGLRNVWRLAFDRKTGHLWAGDVGQNLWEEINIITRGGNYGWNLREGEHPFGKRGTNDRSDLVDPIWEYDHEVGKSITGGTVYRGSQLPSLLGSYIYADYVTGKIWALRYDAKQKRVVSNHAIPTGRMPVISFGEDEGGEVYFTIVASNGQGLYRFVPKK